jgi:hypothetical protein
MIITMEGSSAAKRKFLHGFAHMLAIELEIDHFDNKVIIYVKKDLRKDRGYAGVSGLLNGTCGVGLDSKLGFERTMSTLAHEMVHVKQLLEGTLKVERDDGKDIFIWKGEVFKTEGLLYVDRPWELEAYSQQEVLVKRITGKICGEDQVKVS